MEPFFEENPWLLIPLVIVIVEVWNAAKRAVRAAMKRNDVKEVQAG